MSKRKKTVTRKKSGGRQKPNTKDTSSRKSTARSRQTSADIFYGEVQKRLDEAGMNMNEAFGYQTRSLQGRVFEAIGLTSLFLTEHEAEKYRKSVVGYDTIVRPEGNSNMWRVLTSVEPLPNMPEKPSDAEVRHLREQFEKFLKNEVMTPTDEFSIGDVGVGSYDSEWGRRDGLYAGGGSLRGKVDYTHPMLRVHMDSPDYLEWHLGHKGNAEKYGIFIEPYSYYIYSVTKEM
jgi:hypothetical protein